MRRFYVIAAALIAIGLVALLIGHTTGSDHTPGHAGTVTVHVDGPDRDRKADDVVKAPADLVRKAEGSDIAGHAGARDETPPHVSRGTLEAAQAARDYLRSLQPPLPTAGASQGFPGCTTRFVQNQSSRNGVRPQDIFDHYTVSVNRPGWGDVWAVVALFDRASFSASSNFVIDREGHCAYIVPIEAKAWTQAASNSFAVSIEIVNTGSERTLMDPAGYARLVAVHREIGRRVGIPMRRGAIRSCTPARSGIVQHADGGLCSGGHTDIRPFSIDAIVRMSQKGAVVSRFAVLTKPEHRSVSLTCTHRARRNKLRRGTDAWTRENRYVADHKAQVHRNYVRLHSPWSLRNRGTRRKLQVAVYVNTKGACRP